MAGVKDIIIHVDIEVAERARICHHNRRHHGIILGQKCLVVHEPSGGRKNYCPHCAVEILSKAGEKLATLQQEIQR